MNFDTSLVGAVRALVDAMLGRPAPWFHQGTISRRRNPRNPEPYTSLRSLRRKQARAQAEMNARRIERVGIAPEYMHSRARRRAGIKETGT